MSIQIVSSYLVGHQLFPTIQQAQSRELSDLMAGDKVATDNELKAADWIVEHSDEVVAILTCQPKGKKTRSDKGKKRAAKEKAAVP